MKKILLLFLIIPGLGLAQLNLDELKSLADHKNDVNLQFIKKKGFVYREDKDIGDGTKKIIYEKSKISNSLIVMRVDKEGRNLISYVPENKASYDEILNAVKKSDFKSIDSSKGENDFCYEFTSDRYFSRFCEVKFPSNEQTSYSITFYRNDDDFNFMN